MNANTKSLMGVLNVRAVMLQPWDAAKMPR